MSSETKMKATLRNHFGLDFFLFQTNKEFDSAVDNEENQSKLECGGKAANLNCKKIDIF